MLLEELTVHNFGVYRGRQTINLAPPSAKKPIVLFGGLNGGGKTTLLDSIHLALYGKRAKCSNRGNLAYEDFLRKCVHRGVDLHEGAAVELQFHRFEEGVQRTYRINRSWMPNGKGARERVEVLRDGHLDTLLTDAWDDQVEEFLPYGVSNLFLFDGEKLEELADVDTSSRLLDTAIGSLLGLDLVDQLRADLNVLERRKRTSLKSDADKSDIDAAQAELSRLLERRSEVVAERAAAQTEFEQTHKQLKVIEQRFRQEGGELFEGRTRIETERTSAQAELHRIEDELRDLAGGEAPLLLTRELLKAVASQHAIEVGAETDSAVEEVLMTRDAKLLRVLGTSGASKKSQTAIERFLVNDRKARARRTAKPQYLCLSRESGASLSHLLAESFDHVTQRTTELLNDSDNTQALLIALDRKLAAVPNQDALAELVRLREGTRVAVESAKARRGALDGELQRVSAEIEQKEARVVARIESAVDTDFEQEDTVRVIAHAEQVRETLESFRGRILDRHVGRIEKLVLESLKQLMRKDRLIDQLRIHPKTLTVELTGRDGGHLSPERLSAGERQLLAVSFLWGLARASGRPLPTVIDTPLGRLDSTHRTHLVERYFPHASHQVLLFSTDEEIDETYYPKIKRWVGHSYVLDFNETDSATTVRPGYFW